MITPNPKTSGGARWNYLAAWGYALKQQRRRRDEGARVRARALSQRAGARLRRARLDHHLRRARHRRRAARLGERGVPRAQGARARTSSRSSCRRSASWPSRRSRWSIKSSTRRARARSPQAYLEFLYTPEGQEHRRASTTTGRRSKAVAAEVRDSSSRKLEAVHDRRGLRRLGQGAEDALRRRRRVRPDLSAAVRRRGCRDRPGWRNSALEHWQSRWEVSLPGTRRVEQHAESGAARRRDRRPAGGADRSVGRAVRCPQPRQHTVVPGPRGACRAGRARAGAVLVAPADVERAAAWRPARVRAYTRRERTRSVHVSRSACDLGSTCASRHNNVPAWRLVGRRANCIERSARVAASDCSRAMPGPALRRRRDGSSPAGRLLPGFGLTLGSRCCT